MHRVNSSQIAEIGWESGTLFVSFHSGGTYSYQNVPEELFTKMLIAPSPSGIFNGVIKKNPAKYPFTKL